MGFYLNAKGDLAPLFSWFAIVLITLMVSWWFISNFTISKSALENISNDLRNIEAITNEACNTESFFANYNPVVERGTLDFNVMGVCIESDGFRRCRKPICHLSVDRHIDLAEISKIKIMKTDLNGVDILEADG